MHRLRAFTMATLLACTLACCAAPAPQAPQASPATAAAQDAAPMQPTAAQPAATTPAARKSNPRTGGPLPPRVLPEPVRINRSCSSDADCTVKNVGNCCGTAPACVNVDSPTDPKAVQAACAKQGMASICGFKPIDHCQCVQGQCHAELMMSEAQ